MTAPAGTTIQLTDGTYVLPQTLVFRQPGVTLRSKSGNRDAVTIDGAYAVGELLLVTESNITVADVTLKRAFNHAVHVAPERQTTTGTLIHNIRVVDAGEQFVKINPNNGYYTDDGVVRCSSFEMTDVGRAQVRNNCYTGGVDGLQAQGWHVYLNVFSGFWCSQGLSQHAIHFWTSSRNTTIDRNVIMNSARGIGLGLGETTPVFRNYPDQPCGGKIGLGHYGGSITNNFIFANDPRLFTSGAGMDIGIGLEQSCETNVLHNTVFSTAPPFSSIEWRWPNTLATIANNIVSHNLRPRDGAVATLAGNLVNAPGALFVDAVSSGDLHLTPTATAAIDQGAVLTGPVAWDFDGAPRSGRPDIGADEVTGAGTSPPSGGCTPSPAGTQAMQICDANGALWTLGPHRETMRNGAHAGGGYGSLYAAGTVNGALTVSTLGLDTAWWVWTGAAWVVAAPAPATGPSGCTPSPAGTQGTQICDASGASWTLGPRRETMRNGAHVGGGYGSLYAAGTVNGALTVSTLGLDTAWWTWTGTAWVVAPPAPATGPSGCTPSPAGTQATQICDANGALWTLGPRRETMRNGTHVGGGYGSLYAARTVNGALTIATLGLDTAWWTWTGAAWVVAPTAPATGPSGCTPSPPGTQATQICDVNGALWTLGPRGETMRNGTHVGVGYGSLYAAGAVNGTLTVSTLGLDTAWWTWTGSQWLRP
jgi:hypothetical protein